MPLRKWLSRTSSWSRREQPQVAPEAEDFQRSPAFTPITASIDRQYRTAVPTTPTTPSTVPFDFHTTDTGSNFGPQTPYSETVPDREPVTPAADSSPISEAIQSYEKPNTFTTPNLGLIPPTPDQPSRPQSPSNQPVAAEVDRLTSLAVSPALTPAASVFPEDVQDIMQRKIWVKRQGASATLVKVSDDDLVDTVRDVILQKYANSLGRSIDSPDINLKIVSREQSNKNVPPERMLGPEEYIGRTLDSYYPGGQSIDEALIIEVPQRRTPKPSPRVGNHHPLGYVYYDDHRPSEGAREYFPPMAVHSPHLANHAVHSVPINGPHMGPHSMAVLTTGQLPPLPSPGGHNRRERKPKRPEYVRQHTSSPTILHSTQPHSNDLPKQTLPNGISSQLPMPTPPAQAGDHRPTITPPRTTSPHPSKSSKRKNKGGPTRSINGEPPPPSKPQQPGTLDGNVPPINVLIVEDNPINLRLLEQFMRRLKVRWSTAMNGREAVDTWRKGGFHLVLMDIQLPVMNGLEATKEIRRLEGVNGIGLGLLGGQTANGGNRVGQNVDSADRLADMSLFKSPVIIVALTASSLQSDRHEALAVGCNDFLTKPVTLPWMLRKVTEWGCMQALIDFEGWRQWKANAENKDNGLTEEQKKLKEKEEKAKQKAALKAMFAAPPPSRKEKEPAKESEKDEKKEVAEREPLDSQSGLSSRKTSTSNATTSTGALPPRGGRSVRGSSGSGTVLETHQEELEE
ncbi:Two-component response regulator SSK1p [Lithohypha guttulata]|uniref:Two-component response regulator SSK1p n=1 Tax=Lithohypha guttulata TaxID=1690604 RepID=UPI002DDE3382|nr:Two-component response regulator SSK1p [Lithohypha guttulata]KAK5099317.1 Two-component response regulator SSK1p [Lithohypha guttulata]